MSSSEYRPTFPEHDFEPALGAQGKADEEVISSSNYGPTPEIPNHGSASSEALPDTPPLRQRTGVSRIASIKRVIVGGLREAENLWDLYSLFHTGIDTTYREMTILERLRLISTELILSVLYVGVLAWFVSRHLDNLIPAWKTASSFLISTAIAQSPTVQSTSSVVKITIMTMYSVVVIIVLLMSAYSALLRKPPLPFAKDILRLTLGFATGQITAAGFLI